MTISQHILKTLWSGVDPFAGFTQQRFRPDLQGWNSHHEFLSEAALADDVTIVVEIGVWKGGSTIHMASTAKAAGHDIAVIAVDTWLGSWEHWENSEFFKGLLFQQGYPSLYYTFLTNVFEAGVQDTVVPLPIDSANAAFVINRKGISPDVIHIDGGHDYEAVMSDLKRWWPLLRPGGHIIADDYDADGVVWPTVQKAVDDFLKETQHIAFKAVPYKCRFYKPK